MYEAKNRLSLYFRAILRLYITVKSFDVYCTSKAGYNTKKKNNIIVQISSKNANQKSSLNDKANPMSDKIPLA